MTVYMKTLCQHAYVVHIYLCVEGIRRGRYLAICVRHTLRLRACDLLARSSWSVAHHASAEHVHAST